MKMSARNKDMRDTWTFLAMALAMTSLLLVVLMGAALLGGTWKPMVTHQDAEAVAEEEARSQALTEATLAAARQAAWDAAWARRLATRPVYYALHRPAYHHWRPHHGGHGGHGEGISITNTVGNLSVDTPEPAPEPVAEEPAV